MEFHCCTQCHVVMLEGSKEIGMIVNRLSSFNTLYGYIGTVVATLSDLAYPTRSSMIPCMFGVDDCIICAKASNKSSLNSSANPIAKHR